MKTAGFGSWARFLSNMFFWACFRPLPTINIYAMPSRHSGRPPRCRRLQPGVGGVCTSKATTYRATPILGFVHRCVTSIPRGHPNSGTPTLAGSTKNYKQQTQYTKHQSHCLVRCSSPDSRSGKLKPQATVLYCKEAQTQDAAHKESDGGSRKTRRMDLGRYGWVWRIL